jgi:adenosylcobinamide-phosphate synthase
VTSLALRSLLEPAVASIALGGLLDEIVGDPRGFPHPVRLIGGAIAALERIARRIVSYLHAGAKLERALGIVIALGVPAATAAIVWGIVFLCDRSGYWPALAGRSILIAYGLAAKSLAVETLRASRAIDLETARRELSMIVGRDTAELDRREIHRACVETVGENATDAVVAPLFWLALAGPVGLWTYKAISTLDSMIGYKNKRYYYLGWASARLDDLAALIPARLCLILIAIAATLRGESGRSAVRIGLRDARKHASPNSGWGEAAIAGALGVQLGGRSTYHGVPADKPLLGEAAAPIDESTVERAVAVMRTASRCALAATISIKWITIYLYSNK